MKIESTPKKPTKINTKITPNMIMKKNGRLIFLAISLVLIFSSCVQRSSKEIFTVGPPVEINALKNDHFNSKYSPDGRLLLTTSQSGNGLKIYDTHQQKVSILTQAIAAGLDVHFSADSKNVYYITHDYSGKKRKSNLVIQSIKTGAIKTIARNVRHLKLLQTPSNKVVFYENGVLKQYDLSKHAFSDDSGGITGIFTNDDLKITLVKEGKSSMIHPFPEGDYLWVSLSPNKKRILFTLAGKGTYSCDLEGRQIIQYGRLHAAKWSSDGQQIIGMDDYDDGEKYIKSDIILIPSNGGKRQNLTSETDIIALFPTFSPNDKFVIFNDENGQIYSINL